MRFIAVDPGKATGVAVWDYEATIDPITFTFAPLEFYNWLLEDVVRSFVPIDVVCEAYTISQRTLKASAQLWSLELIGVLRFATWVRQMPFALQQASAAKRFATNDKLKELGWYRPGHDHENDALRHLLLKSVTMKVITL